MISNCKNNYCKIRVAIFSSKQHYVSPTERICVSHMTFICGLLYNGYGVFSGGKRAAGA